MKKEEIIFNNNITLKKITLDNSKIKFDTIIENKDFLQEWLEWPKFYHEEKNVIDYVSSIIDRFNNDEEYVYDIYYNDEFTGCIGLQNISKMDNRCEIGYWLSKKYNGKGIMTSAVKAILEYAFNELNFHKVSILCAPLNHKSNAIIKRCGLELEAVLRENELLNGKYIDSNLYSVLKDEWNSRKR